MTPLVAGSIEEIESWIPLADGTRLAATIWLPTAASEEAPVPAVLEYVPYRKNDMTADRDALMHPFFAQNGYASVRVDIRGSGDSDGLLEDEYLQQEQSDAVEVIAWLAEQTWSTGKVGMIGISWGGFAGLQVAAENPPALAGVISLASTDDRYIDDVHYMGGAVNAWDQLSWGATVTALAALPPSGRARDDWREVWLSRLENVEPIGHEWMSHQTRDAYWKHGSVIEDYNAMSCPIFMVGGWNDAYRDSVFRVLEGYEGVAKGLIGPWAHTYPHAGAPGPAIDFLGLAVRWWDYCLKGVDNGIQDEPKMQVWMQDALPAHAGYAERSGDWIAYDEWPSASQDHARFFLNEGGALGTSPTTESVVSHSSGLVPPSDRGNWCPGGFGTQGSDIPGDQRAEDEKSLVFTGGALDSTLAMLGLTRLRMRVSSDKSCGLLAVRLVDVHPDGSSTLVSRGFLNLSHRNGDERPERVEPGVTYDVSVTLRSNAYRFERGHRVRVAIDTAYWPWVWPSPEQATLSITLGEDTVIDMPLQPIDDVPPVDLGESRSAAPLVAEALLPAASATRTMGHNPSTNVFEITDAFPLQLKRLADRGLVHGTSGETRYLVEEGDPLSARIECRRDFTFAEDRRTSPTRVEVQSSMSSTATDFLVTTQIEAYEANRRIFARNWTRTIPREQC